MFIDDAPDFRKNWEIHHDDGRIALFAVILACMTKDMSVHVHNLLYGLIIDLLLITLFVELFRKIFRSSSRMPSNLMHSTRLCGIFLLQGDW